MPHRNITRHGSLMCRPQRRPMVTSSACTLSPGPGGALKLFTGVFRSLSEPPPAVAPLVAADHTPCNVRQTRPVLGFGFPESFRCPYSSMRPRARSTRSPPGVSVPLASHPTMSRMLRREGAVRVTTASRNSFTSFCRRITCATAACNFIPRVDIFDIFEVAAVTAPSLAVLAGSEPAIRSEKDSFFFCCCSAGLWERPRFSPARWSLLFVGSPPFPSPSPASRDMARRVKISNSVMVWCVATKATLDGSQGRGPLKLQKTWSLPSRPPRCVRW
mmetsp:Transcript_58058/g.116679  ORF Transcript_58058/g.116679 Transcript_58058/m.116679 type:complete len:274 (-) Transcript_58058:831-1652(-)